MTDRDTVKPRRLWRYPLYLLLVSFIGLEIALRLLDPLGIVYFFEAHRYFKTVQPDERFAYIHPANYREKFQGVEIATNQYGLRGPEFSAKKTDTRKRIMILGDSVVLGWGVDYAGIFPARLQEMLDQAGAETEIIPAGVGSWNTRTEYEFLQARGVEYEPDTLILVVVGNDVEIKREGRTAIARETLTGPKPEKSWFKNAAEDIWRSLIRNTYSFAYIQYLWKQLFDSGTYSELSGESPAWQDARLALEGIIELCRESDIELLVYLYRSAAQDKADPPLHLYQDYLLANNIPVFAMPEQLFRGDLDYQNSVIDVHTNARGHELIARQMQRDLAPWLAD